MNAPLLYYRNALGAITYDPRGFVVLEWADAPITPAELQSLYAHTLQALRHHNTCKLLTVQTHRQPLPEADQQWIAEQWIPQAIADCAYSHCAIVEAAQAAHRAGARAVGTRIGSAVAFRYFATQDQASDWLQAT
jgi:hypothetical protein